MPIKLWASALAIMAATIVMFALAPAAHAGSTVVGVPSGKCLDLDHGRKNGAVHLWDCNGGSNQSWHLNGGKQLVNDATNQCLYVNIEVSNIVTTATNDEMGLVTRDCNVVHAIGWDWDGATFRSWHKIDWKGPDYLCIDVDHNGNKNGTNVLAFHCNGGPNQKWRFKP